jgi:hypothetical protein
MNRSPFTECPSESVRRRRIEGILARNAANAIRSKQFSIHYD